MMLSRFKAFAATMFLCCVSFVTMAQNPYETPVEQVIRVNEVTESPRYEGGQTAFIKHIQSKVTIPTATYVRLGVHTSLYSRLFTP